MGQFLIKMEGQLRFLEKTLVENVKNHVSVFSHNTKKVTFWCHNEHGFLLVVDASVGL
jgi:hypothetical protein